MQQRLRLHLLLGGLCAVAGLSCERWNLAEKDFLVCANPSAQISAQAQQLAVTVALTDTTGSLTTVDWAFGDGNTATAGAAQPARHTYQRAGTYTVKATLTNRCGETREVTQQLTVSNVVPPTVTTLDATDVGLTTATFRLSVTSAGNGTLTRYGVVYSTTNPLPTVADARQERSDNPALSTALAFPLTQLTENTTYYVRAFAENSAGIGYDATAKTVRTAALPTLTTGTATAVSRTGATVTLRVTSAGSPAATRYGIAYSATNANPRLGSANVVDVVAPAPNTDAPATLSGLTPNTTYYYRAFAVSAVGTVYTDEVRTLITESDVDITTGLVAYLSLNGTATDQSGTGNNGTLVNGATYTTDRRGGAASALLLDGVNDYLDIADAISLRPANITVSLWIRPADLSRTMQLFNKSRFADGAAEQYSALMRPAGNGTNTTINVDVKQNGLCRLGEGWQTISGNGTLQANAWYHVVAVFDGRVGRLYLNGTQINVSSSLPANGIDNCPGGSLKFGAQSAAFPNYFAGAIDEIRVYNRPLTEAQVRALYNQ